MSKWRKKQLQEIAFLKPTENLKKGDIAPNIPMANIKEFQRDVVKIDYGEFRGGTKFRNGDTLLAKITPCLENGKTAFVNCLQEDEIGFGSTEFIVLRAKENIDERFLYYLSISPEFRKQAISLMEGTSGRKRVNENALKISDFLIPDLEEQRKIANILSAIDDKIQINNQINQELEAMAKTLYDYWFVQFDFPDQNGKPYKSSGGKMVYNPELKREIPEGWGVEKLSEFLVLNKDKYNKELNWQKIHYLETSNLIENKIEKLKKLDIKSDKIPSRAKEIVKDRDILYSLVRPNQMHFGFIRNPIQNLVASTGFVLLSCEVNPIYNIFFYLFMTLPNNVRRMIKLSESSTSSYPSIRPEDILNMEIVTPYDFSNYRSLVEYLDKIYYQIDVLYKQNEALIQLRDWLLPMLMNGQVKVE